MSNHTVRVDGQAMRIEFRRYTNGNVAMLLFTEGGMPYLTASVNTEARLPEGYIAIKNWSENEGILEALVRDGIVADDGATMPVSDFVAADICKLLIEAS